MTFLALCFLLYFLPAVLASSRRHPSGIAICVTNLFLGWTGIGWLLCLVWALSGPREVALYPQPVYAVPMQAAPASWASSPRGPGELICAVCHRLIAANARYCPMCGATGSQTA